MSIQDADAPEGALALTPVSAVLNAPGDLPEEQSSRCLPGGRWTITPLHCSILSLLGAESAPSRCRMTPSLRTLHGDLSRASRQKKCPDVSRKTPGNKEYCCD